MKNIKLYQLFIFLSTLSRNMLEIFSTVILYQQGFSIKEIFLFYFIIFLTGVFSNTLSIIFGKIISYKLVLIVSSILYGITFYYLSVMQHMFSNLIIFAILFSFSSFSYHVIRHYFALKTLSKENKKEIGNILIATYLALIPASYLGAIITNYFTLNVAILIVIIISILGIIPLFLLKVDTRQKNKIKIDISKIPFNSLLFFIFEQFKVIFITFQPLYIYLYVSNNLEFIGIFNILLGISSVIFVYFFVRKIKEAKYFKILNIIFCLILIIKINIYHSMFLLIIAFFEGLGTKMFEIVSTNNIYNVKNIEVNGYLILVEIIFCLSRALICIICYFLISDLKVMLYFCILGILICSFVRYKSYN